MGTHLAWIWQKGTLLSELILATWMEAYSLWHECVQESISVSIKLQKTVNFSRLERWKSHFPSSRLPLSASAKLESHLLEDPEMSAKNCTLQAYIEAVWHSSSGTFIRLCIFFCRHKETLFCHHVNNLHSSFLLQDYSSLVGLIQKTVRKATVCLFSVEAHMQHVVQDNKNS